MILFTPGATSNSNPPVNTISASFLHREVVDIRDTTEFEFVVPYASTIPYRQIGSTYFSGRLDVMVLNQLRAPSTVQPYVRVLVEVCAAPDFEFAAPLNFASCYPYLYGDNTNQGGLENQGETIEGADTVKTVDQEPVSGIGTSIISPKLDLINAKYCMGERVVSLRQLIKRVTPFARMQSDTNQSWQNWISPYLHMVPVFNTGNATPAMMEQTMNAVSVTRPHIFCDLLSWVSICYAYQTGGIRLKTYSDVGLNYSLTTFNLGRLGWYGGGYGIGTNPSYGKDVRGMTILPSNPYVNPFSEIQIPYYNSTFMHPITNATTGATPTPELSAQKRNIYIEEPQTGVMFRSRGNGQTIYVQRGASEDFNLAMFTGVPPTFNATQTGYFN
jgi:hypothetical protein